MISIKKFFPVNASNTRLRVARMYFPYLCLAIVGFALINQIGAAFVGSLFILFQIIVCEINYVKGEEFWFNRLRIDVAPFAAIILGYYFSFLAGLIGMIIPVILQDHDRDVSKFAELEDIIFNSIAALAASMLRSIPFLPLATALIILRLISLVILHYSVLGELDPRKFLSEGASTFIILAFVIGLLHVFA